MPSTVDLHIHTTASDGSDSPAELLENLKKAGITTFSVTDHDTIDGALEMEQLVAEDFRFIRGIEFSCETPAGKCHILGYNFDPKAPAFHAALADGAALRQEKLLERLDYLERTLQITFTDAEVAWLNSQKSPGKPHFGKLLVDRCIAATIDEAIQKYINPHKPRRDRIDGSTAVAAILHAGGIPVWAHPLGGEGEKRLTVEKFKAQLAYLKEQGIRGLECHYSRYTPEDCAFLTTLAEKNGLLISGGSDYHGSNKQDLPLGQLCTDGSQPPREALTILKLLE
jgi:predicted metal-dependent phosphoesterase TrpH